MRIEIAILIAGCGSGCILHHSELQDERIKGVLTTYQGATPPRELAYARRLMVLTDQEDGSLQRQQNLHGEERACEERRLEKIQGALRELTQAVQGAIINASLAWPSEVTIWDQGGALVGTTVLTPGEHQPYWLAPGQQYTFHFHRPGWRTYATYTLIAPAQTGWVAGVKDFY